MLQITRAHYAPLRDAVPWVSRYVTQQLNDYILREGHGSELRLGGELNNVFGGCRAATAG
jgi:hypothetical protein